MKIKKKKLKKVKKVKKVKSQNKLVKELTDSIAEKITAGLAKIAKSNKASKANRDKKAQLGGNKDKLQLNGKFKVATLKSGKAIEIGMGQAKDLGHWMQALVRKDYVGMAKYFAKLEPLNTATDEDGGFLVPTLLHNVLVPLIEDQAVIRPLATHIDMSNMKTNQLNVDQIVGKPIATWSGENTVKGTSSMQFAQISLTPYVLAVIVPFTKQLMTDSVFNVVKMLTKSMTESIVKEEERAFMVGNGAGQPTGINNYTPGRAVDAGNNLNFDHINAAYWRMPQAFRNKAVWFMNGRTIENVSMIKDDQNRPLLLDNGILTQPGIPAMKGRPVFEQNDLPSAQIVFVDPSMYWIADKWPMTVDMATEATIRGISLFEKNLIALRVEERVDAELVDTRAFTRVNNTGVA
ncbi:hypothetical protein LCGC14_1517320 [marine sediment metagenome]|uniref:Phage capsid-like C-terminal domain-containing protein n=1 Tax=marine sediment metagenome TaxID=412755 RepID=A0A0F9IZX0_9ZZZZ